VAIADGNKTVPRILTMLPAGCADRHQVVTVSHHDPTSSCVE
jgi:hypothetical protein